MSKEFAVSDLKDEVRFARKKSGLTQEGLALATGLSVTSISNIERGIHIPSMSNLAKISEATKHTFSCVECLNLTGQALTTILNLKLSLRDHPRFEDILDSLQDVECILLDVAPLSPTPEASHD